MKKGLKRPGLYVETRCMYLEHVYFFKEYISIFPKGKKKKLLELHSD